MESLEGGSTKFPSIAVTEGEFNLSLFMQRLLQTKSQSLTPKQAIDKDELPFVCKQPWIGTVWYPYQWCPEKGEETSSTCFQLAYTMQPRGDLDYLIIKVHVGGLWGTASTAPGQTAGQEMISYANFLNFSKGSL